MSRRAPWRVACDRGRLRRAVGRLRRVAGPVLAVAAVAGATAALFAARRRVTLLVVNATESAILFVVDDRPVGPVAPTPEERAGAGLLTTLPGGTLRLRALRPDGAVVDEREVELAPGGHYLYAPAHGEQCFTLEREVYGAARRPGPARVVLDPERSLWRLPATIDAHFFANPPAPEGGLSSGGVRLALRQRPCAAAHEDR